MTFHVTPLLSSGFLLIFHTKCHSLLTPPMKIIRFQDFLSCLDVLTDLQHFSANVKTGLCKMTSLDTLFVVRFGLFAFKYNLLSTSRDSWLTPGSWKELPMLLFEWSTVSTRGDSESHSLNSLTESTTLYNSFQFHVSCHLSDVFVFRILLFAFSTS